MFTARGYARKVYRLKLGREGDDRRVVQDTGVNSDESRDGHCRRTRNGRGNRKTREGRKGSSFIRHEQVNTCALYE